MGIDLIVNRKAIAVAHSLAAQFRIVCVTGPRQSGKTTLIKKAFKEMPYVNLENPDMLTMALNEPKKFLAQYPKGAIIDEAQKAPILFNYLQQIVDKSNKRGQFVLSGSNNFLLQQSISQSLAGRVAYLELLPLAYNEITTVKGYKKATKEDILLKGSYPELYQQPQIVVKTWMQNYIQTYIEKDVRLLRNIGNANTFKKFVGLCANYAGQQLNINNICKLASIDFKTAKDWLSILESSYIIYFLQPFFENYAKRITQTPKLYFNDTGLLCNLLQINTTKMLISKDKKGAIFENWVITELKKNRLNKGEKADFYYFRDSAGNEIDLLIFKNDQWLPIEIKYNQTFDKEMASGIKWWQKLSRTEGGMVIYGGNKVVEFSENCFAQPWNSVSDI